MRVWPGLCPSQLSGALRHRPARRDNACLPTGGFAGRKNPTMQRAEVSLHCAGTRERYKGTEHGLANLVEKSKLEVVCFRLVELQTVVRSPVSSNSQSELALWLLPRRANRKRNGARPGQLEKFLSKCSR